jgi:hypothetical protein
MQKAYKFGVELETLAPRDTYDELSTKLNALAGIDLTGDGSIRTESGQIGLEIRMGVLGFNSLKRLLPKVERICEQYGVTVNSSTGVHVHISNKRFFVAKYLNRIIKTWVAIEDVLISTQPRSRFNNHYCKRSLAKFIQDNGELKAPEGRQAIMDWSTNQDRYYTLNLSSLRKHGTLECRLHAGSTNAKKIINWTILLTSIYNYALESFDTDKINELFGMASSEEKIAKTFLLLGLDEKVATYFNNRISKFLLPDLAVQQQSAVECLKLKDVFAKAQKAYNKATTELRTVERSRSRHLSNLNLDY